MFIFSGLVSWWAAKQQARTAFIKFFLENFKWIAPLIALLVFALWIRGIINERDEAIKGLNNYINAIETEVESRQQELERLKAESRREVEAIEAKHIEDVNYIAQAYLKGFDREKTLDKKTISNLRNQLTDSMRTITEVNRTDGMPEDDTNRFAGVHSDATIIGRLEKEIEDLRLAGAYAASDYNRCKAYKDEMDRKIGVESQ